MYKMRNIYKNSVHASFINTKKRDLNVANVKKSTLQKEHVATFVIETTSDDRNSQTWKMKS